MRFLVILGLFVTEAFAQGPQIAVEEDAPDPGTARRIPIGSYGEAFYLQHSNGPEEAELRRLILFLGHRFDEHWRIYAEVEIEHGHVVEMEQAYLEGAFSPRLAARAGLVLVPMGIINVLHESPTFHGNERPQVDQAIVPTTWRELGAGLFGELGLGLKYEAYVLRGLDASGFSADRPIRGGRLGGNEGISDSAAGVFRLAWGWVRGLDLGASFYYGDASQGDPALEGVRVTMVEGDARFRKAGFETRAQVAQISIAEVDRIAAAPNDSNNGFYAEVGYDMLHLAEVRQELIPFFRFERIDVGAPDATLVFQGGLTYRPHPQVALKGDVSQIDSGEADETRLALGLGFMF